MLTPQASSTGVSCSPSSSVVIGGASRPQLCGAGPSRRALTGPVKTSTCGFSRAPSQQRRQPAGAGADVVVDEHDQLAAGALDAGVAGGVQPERARVGLVARALRRSVSARTRGDSPASSTTITSAPHSPAWGMIERERHLQVGGTRARGDHDRGRCHGLDHLIGCRKSRFASRAHLTVRCPASMVLFLHNRYRTTGGEERVVEDLLWLVRERLGGGAELLARDSAEISRRRGRRSGCCAAGSRPEEVAGAVRRSGAELVHAHNLHPSFGWRALAAARGAGAAVVLHLHQYRLVCAVGVCFTDGRGVHPLPRAQHAPRARAQLPRQPCPRPPPTPPRWPPGSAAWSALADVILVPSALRARAAARARSAAALGAGARARAAAADPAPPASPAGRELRRAAAELPERYALVVSRLAAGEGDRRRDRGLPPRRDRARDRRRGPGARARWRRLARGGRGAPPRGGGRRASSRGCGPAPRSRSLPRARPRPSGVALAEAMAAGVPVVGSRVGALPEILEEDELVAAGRRARAGGGDRSPGGRPRRPASGARARIAAVCGPEVVADGLRAAYEQARARRRTPRRRTP